MRINFLSRFFKPKAIQSTLQTASNISHAQKAENRLQSRLTDWHGLMRDVQTGDFLELSTGKKFTGKFVVSTNEMEQIHNIKNGKLASLFVREKDGTKHFAINQSGHQRAFGIEDKPSEKWEKMELALDEAFSQMREQFVIDKLMKSGEQSIFIQGNF